MKRTLLMERVLDQTRLAVIEDGALCELTIEQPGSESLSGNVYLGRVCNVLPGMNAAFVDIGLEKNGFLAAGDIRLPVQGDGALAAALGKARIEKLVRPGGEIAVQVIRSQPGAKGPQLSCHITLPGRLMALMCGVQYVGVSRRIDDGTERERLYKAGKSLIENTDVGIILRTAARGANEDALRTEFERLLSLMEDIRQKSRHCAAPRLLYDDNDLAVQAVRDLLTDDVDAVWADDADCFAQLMACARTYVPALAGRIRLHDGQTPLFDLYRVDAQADRALQRRVWLDGGGSLVIEETEALTVVDVNTAKNTGKRGADETILQTNLEAARELTRQLRLRDIGGIIVVDFIDMRRDEDRQALMRRLRECAARDRNHTTVVDMTPLGLVELTRKRVRQSLSKQLTHACAHCGGTGAVPTHEATARRIARELWRRRRGGDDTALLIEASAPVCAALKRIGIARDGRAVVRVGSGLDAGEYRLSPLDGKGQK